MIGYGSHRRQEPRSPLSCRHEFFLANLDIASALGPREEL
jgi:hypothetical protein